MFFRRQILALGLLVLFGISGCAGKRAATASDIGERDWVLASTANFRVYSDLDADRVRDLANELEKDLELIAQAAFGGGDASIDPTEVVVFSKGTHFHRFFRESVGGVSYRAPLLPESPHTVATVRQLSRAMRHTLRHELVHDLFAKRFGATPPWLSEGFAEYFSTVELVGSDIHVGKAPPHRVLTNDFQPSAFGRPGFTVLVIPDRLIPTPSELLGMSAQEFYVWTSDSLDETAYLRTEANYFGAWAFVHFLMDADGEYSTRFNRFLRDVRTTSVKHAWQGAFAGVQDSTLNQAFRAYISTGNLSVGATRYQPNGARQTAKLRALGTGEKHVLLAKLALASSRPEAEREALFLEQIDAATRAQPPAPEAYYVRGAFAASRRHGADAKRDFDKAVQLAPQNPRFLRASLAHDLDSIGGPSRDEVAEEFRPSIEKLEAMSSAPLELLLAAQFFADTGDTERALALGSKAATLDPVDPFVLSKYATVLKSCGFLDEAIDVQRRALEFIYEQRELEKALARDLKRLETLAKEK